MFTSVRRCAEFITQPCGLKAKVTIEGHRFELAFCVRSKSLYPRKDFHKTLIKCSPHGDGVQDSQLNHADPRSKSELMVTCSSLAYRVRSISPSSLKRFSFKFVKLFTLNSRCAESITQPFRVKVKVTIEGHRFEPCISCPLHIFFTPERIFIKL